MIFRFKVKTSKKEEFVDLTQKVKDLVKKSKVESGICTVFTPHTTAAIVANENWEPGFKKDVLKCLETLVPEGIWEHDRVDNNGAAHLKASLLGPSVAFVIENKDLLIGRWQGIALLEFDGPREREVVLKIVRDND